MQHKLFLRLTSASLIAALALTGLAIGHDKKKDRDRDRNDDHKFTEIDVQAALALSPVPLNLTGLKRGLVARGSYIVNAQGACNDCHTCPNYLPGHDPFAGGDGVPNGENYLAGGRQFGPFVSKNITPDADGLPNGMTFQDFLMAIRTGKEHEPPYDTLQVMPWPVYRNMADGDLRAVYEFLRAIPHREPGTCQ